MQQSPVELDQHWRSAIRGGKFPASSCRRHMEAYMTDVEWKPLPTPMWPEGSVMATDPGGVLRPGCADLEGSETQREKCSPRPGLKRHGRQLRGRQGSGAARSGGELGQPGAPSTPPVKPWAAARRSR